MTKLVKSARDVKTKHSIHFKGRITLFKMLQKSGEKYMRNQRVSVSPLKKIDIKKLKIQVIKNITARQCNRCPNRGDVSRRLSDANKENGLSITSKAQNKVRYLIMV